MSSRRIFAISGSPRADLRKAHRVEKACRAPKRRAAHRERPTFSRRNPPSREAGGKGGALGECWAPERATRPSLRHARAARRLVRFHIPAGASCAPGSLPGQCIGGAHAQGPRPQAAEHNFPHQHPGNGRAHSCATRVGEPEARVPGLTAEQWCSITAATRYAKCQRATDDRSSATVRPMPVRYDA